MMRLVILGSKKEGFYIHLETWKDIDDLLLPCPFCGSTDVTLGNTHTAYYHVVCNNCNCEMPGEGNGSGFKTISECASAHEEAINSAIKEWNIRHGKVKEPTP